MAYFGRKKKNEQKHPASKCIIHCSNPQMNLSDNYLQVIGIDPAVEINLAIRCERRYFNGTIVPIMMDHIDFSSGDSPIIYLTKYLDRYISIFMDTHIFLIEQQEVRENIPVIKIASFLLSYLCIRTLNSPKNPRIIEVDSHMKSKTFGFKKQPGLTIKKQCKDFAIRLLQMRNDNASLQALNKAARKQDLCDVICMTEAFFICYKLPTALVL